MYYVPLQFLPQRTGEREGCAEALCGTLLLSFSAVKTEVTPLKV
jgi:hypothetical protein